MEIFVPIMRVNIANKFCRPKLPLKLAVSLPEAFMLMPIHCPHHYRRNFMSEEIAQRPANIVEHAH